MRFRHGRPGIRVPAPDQDRPIGLTRQQVWLLEQHLGQPPQFVGGGDGRQAIRFLFRASDELRQRALCCHANTAWLGLGERGEPQVGNCFVRIQDAQYFDHGCPHTVLRRIESSQQRGHDLATHPREGDHQCVLPLGHLGPTHLLQYLWDRSRPGITQFARRQFALCRVTDQSRDQAVHKRRVFRLLASESIETVEQLSRKGLQLLDPSQFDEFARAVLVPNFEHQLVVG